MRILRRHVSSSHCLFHRRRRNNILSTARRRRRRRRRFKAHRRRAAGRSARSKKQHHRTAHIVRVCSRVRKERWMEKRAPKFFCGGEEGNFIQNFLMCFVCVRGKRHAQKKVFTIREDIQSAVIITCIYITISRPRSVRSGHRQSADLYRSDPCPLHLPQTSLPGTVSHTGHRTSSASSSFFLESLLFSEVVFRPNGRENERVFLLLFAGTYPTLSATEIAFTRPPPAALPALSHPEVRLVQL